MYANTRSISSASHIYRRAGNDTANFRDPTRLSQAGNPLNNLFGGTLGGSALVGPQYRGAASNYSRDIVARQVASVLGPVRTAATTTLRAANPLGTSILNAGLGLGAASLFGPVNYEPGKEFSSGRVSQSGKTFILNEPILNAKGKPQRTAPIVGGSLDLKAFSAGEVPIAITGINDIDRALARKAYGVKYGSVPRLGTKSGQMFHHGPQTGAVVQNGVSLPVARMQLVPIAVNEAFPHEGTAAVARRELASQGVSATAARTAARSYNASALESIQTKGSARALAALAVYATGRDVLQESGIFKRDYSPVGNFEYIFDDGQGSRFTVQPAGWFSSATRTYLDGSRKGQVERIDSSSAGNYRATAEAKYGRYVPGNLLKDPRFIPGTDRQRIDVIDSRGITTGYIDKTGVHQYSPQQSFQRSGI